MAGGGLRVALANARTLIAGYARLPIDYVNFHCYQTGSDPWPLQTSIRYLERATGKTAVTNELGQLDLAPSTVTAELSAVEAKRLPYVIWYGSESSGGTKGLRNADGSLRPNGEAFRAYAAAHAARTARA